MWYTIVHEEVPVGVTELRAGPFVASTVQPLAGYRALRPRTIAATTALLQLGLFGGALPPVPPYPAQLLRDRRAIARAGRLRLGLIDATGTTVDTTFVNLLEAPADTRIIVIAGFGRSAFAHHGARVSPPPSAPGAHKTPE